MNYLFVARDHRERPVCVVALVPSRDGEVIALCVLENRRFISLDATDLVYIGEGIFDWPFVMNSLAEETVPS